MTVAARAAAAKAFFVYPPTEDASAPTAFKVVTQLEAAVGRTARARALELRTEFADTLIRLGDRYWEREGGRPFALDYYAQALVFDPRRERAAQRASMTPGELRDLRNKATTGAFSKHELEAVEPLAALAKADGPDSEDAIAVLEEEQEKRSVASRARIARLAKRAKRRKRKRAKSEALEVAREAEPPTTPPTEPPSRSAADAEPVDVEPSNDREAKAQARQANKALARSRTAEGDALRQKGALRAAATKYAAALAADARYAPAHAGLARVHYDEGQYALAARKAKNAVRLAPRKGDYRILLGDALYKTYDTTGAKNQYTRAAELGHPKAKARLARLNKK